MRHARADASAAGVAACSERRASRDRVWVRQGAPTVRSGSAALGDQVLDDGAVPVDRRRDVAGRDVVGSVAHEARDLARGLELGDDLAIVASRATGSVTENPRATSIRPNRSSRAGSVSAGASASCISSNSHSLSHSWRSSPGSTIVPCIVAATAIQTFRSRR
jgi:hypothetical protein